MIHSQRLNFTVNKVTERNEINRQETGSAGGRGGLGRRQYLEDPGDGQREAGGPGHQQELGEAQAEGQQAAKAENEEGVARRSQLCRPEQLLSGAEAQTCRGGCGGGGGHFALKSHR